MSDILNLVELRCATIQHCHALLAVTKFLEDGNTTLAISRLDQAIQSLDSVVRGQVVGQMLRCPQCNHEQEIVQWVDLGRCCVCDAPMELTPKE